MNIAILGWGSLVWCPGSLRIRTRWRLEGPVLPIEFARISEDGRLTLVIHPGSAGQPTYWALSEFADREEARSNVCEREGSPLHAIHYLDLEGEAAEGILSGIRERVTKWLVQGKNIQAVIWTGLQSNWKEKRGSEFTPEDGIRFLLDLEAEQDRAKAKYERAREYVRNAPPGVDTAVRAAMRTRGWEDAGLPTILFETPCSQPSTESK